jgi:hypothetical protein
LIHSYIIKHNYIITSCAQNTCNAAKQAVTGKQRRICKKDDQPDAFTDVPLAISGSQTSNIATEDIHLAIFKLISPKISKN